jgi:signal peptidase II
MERLVVGSRHMAKRAMGWFLLVFTVSLVGCDHATKIAAKAVLGDGRSVALVPGLLDLRYTENHDTAFSLLRAFHFATPSIVLVMLASLALFGVAFQWWRSRLSARTIEHVGYALTLAGAIGNVADRALRGYVVDFIHLHHWPVFNVADIAVVAGIAVLAFAHRSSKPPSKSTPTKSDDDGLIRAYPKESGDPRSPSASFSRDAMGRAD